MQSGDVGTFSVCTFIIFFPHFTTYYFYTSLHLNFLVILFYAIILIGMIGICSKSSLLFRVAKFHCLLISLSCIFVSSVFIVCHLSLSRFTLWEAQFYDEP